MLLRYRERPPQRPNVSAKFSTKTILVSPSVSVEPVGAASNSVWVCCREGETMNTIELSQTTKGAISRALRSPGTNNQNNSDAYNAIYRETRGARGFNSGTVYWFSQAGAINSPY